MTYFPCSVRSADFLPYMQGKKKKETKNVIFRETPTHPKLFFFEPFPQKVTKTGWIFICAREAFHGKVTKVQVCVHWFTCYEREGNQKGGEEKNWEIWANHLHFSLFTCLSCQGISYAGCLFSQIIRGALPQKQPLFTSPCQYLCHLVTTLYSQIAWKHIVAHQL